MMGARAVMRAVLALLVVPTVFGQGTAPVGTNNTGPLSQYKSRPDIYAPAMNMTILDQDAVTPGYIFLGIYQTFQDSLYIYDNAGNLVYSGYGGTGGGPSHNFHVCNVKGTDQLCYITGAQNVGYARGYGVVMDNTFTTVTSIKSGGGVANFDEHEFNVVDDGKNVLMTLYQPQQYDLTPWNISNGQGWLMNCYFQKLELGTNQLLFEWNALDHVSIDETFVLPNTTDVSGSGLDPTLPWDWFHINAVDQNSDGDYLVSSRHTSTIYKVSGQDGHIIWRLGGSRSDFTFPTFQNYTRNFTFQHDARFREENATTTILSLFDNGSNGYNKSSGHSAGLIIKLDHTSNSVSWLRSYQAPYKVVSASQGNLQILGPNSAWSTANIFHGWGNQAYVTEHLNNGTMIQLGTFASTGSMNYRAFKYNYTMNPTDSPALYTYAYSNSSNTVYYVSWNGATEASSWRFYSSMTLTGPFTSIDTIAKTGFETTYVGPHFYPWSIVEALDSNGNAIKNCTRPIRTFVPGKILAANCDQYGCPSAVSGIQASAPSTTSIRPTTSSSSSASMMMRRGDEQVGWGGMAMMGVGAVMLPHA